ncbi:MAG: AAA family ATPase [Myxococcota bacterium]
MPDGTVELGDPGRVSSADRSPTPARFADASTVGPFVGRERELNAALRGLADRMVVSIVGPSGAGKTRLAHEIAGRITVPSRTVMLPLRSVETADEFLRCLALHLSLPPLDQNPERQLDALIEWLGGQSVELLVADGVDQMSLEAVTALGEIAQRTGCPTIYTSQSPRRLEEVMVSLGPLDAKAARTLLAQRMSIARGGPMPTPTEERQLDALAEKLDRLPLLLELAGARLSVLSVDQLRRRLSANLEALGAPERMSATVRMAVSLLEPDERRGLSQLAVFLGSFEADAAEAVIDRGIDGLSLLTVLVDRSLLRIERTASGSARFSLYEPVRQYVLAHHAASTEAARQRHARFFAESLVQWRRASPRRIMVERDDIAAAIARVDDPGVRIDLILRQERWRYGGRSYEEDYALIEELVAASERLSDPLRRAEALLAAGRFHRLRGRWDRALGRLKEAEAEARRAGLSDEVLGEVLVEQGRWECCQGNYSQAEKRFEEGSRLVRDPVILGDVQTSLGTMAFHRGDFNESARHVATARDLYRQGGDRSGEAVASMNHCMAVEKLEPTENCIGRLREAIERLREVGNLRSEGIGLGNLANWERRAGNYSAARPIFKEALRIHGYVGNRRSEALNRGYLAQLHIAEGELALAAEELREARRLGAAIRSPGDLAQIVEAEIELHRARGDSEALARAERERASLLGVGYLEIDAEGRWFRLPGETQRCELGRRQSARLLLRELCRHREGPLALEEIVAACWPGERIRERSARQRVYVLINSLRRLGLSALKTVEGGYLLDASIPLKVVPATEP